MKKILMLIPILIMLLVLGIGAADTKAQELNPLPITEVDYSQMGTVSFTLTPTSQIAELYFIVPKGTTNIWYEAYNTEFNFYDMQYISLPGTTNDVALQTESFANDIYITWFGSSEGSILLNYYDMYRYYGEILLMPFTATWDSQYGSFSQTFSFSGSSITIVWDDDEWNILSNNVQKVYTFVDIYTQGYNTGFLANNVDAEVSYNYGYSQGAEYGYNAALEEYAYNDFGTYISGLEAYLKGFNVAKENYAWFDNGNYYTGDQAYSYGYDAGQNEELNFLSIITSFLFGIGAIFAIEFIPGISIGSVALIPIALTLFPKLIGLISGAAVFVEKSAKSATISSGKKGGKK